MTVRRSVIAIAVAVVAAMAPWQGSGATPSIEPSPAPTASLVQVGTAPPRDPLGVRTVTRLPDGRVLFIDGANAQLWDPVSGAWSPAGTLHSVRDRSITVAPLPDGRVVVMGGLRLPRISGGRRGFPADIEVWDPSTATFSVLGRLPRGRHAAQAFTLADGRVLIVGGGQDARHFRDALAWDPTDGSVTRVARLPRTTVSRGDGVRTLVTAGAPVIVTGGFPPGPGPAILVLAVDPASGAVAVIHRMPGYGPVVPYALPDGRVLLVAEGWEFGCHLMIGASCEGSHGVDVVDPATGVVTEVVRGVGGVRSAQLPDGSVVLVEARSAACSEGLACASAGRVTRWDPASGDVVTLGTIADPLSNPSMATLADGTVLVTSDERLWRIDPATAGIDVVGMLPRTDAPWARALLPLLDGRALLLVEGGAVLLWTPPATDA